MTSGGNNFNDFPENELKFRASQLYALFSFTIGLNSLNTDTLPKWLYSLQAYLVERYCITVPNCPDIIWG